MSRYSYRLLTPEDLPGLNRLFESAFQSNPKDNFFLWKYFSNPAGNALVAGAFENDQLVGSGAMMPEILNMFDREELVFKCTDLMTHPDHQRRGISKKINELLKLTIKEKKAPFSYTLCTKISTKSFLKNEWICLAPVVNFFKPKLFLKISNLFRKNKSGSFGFFDRVEGHLDDYGFKHDISLIGIKKTSQFLQWRTSNPNFVSKIICSFNSSQCVNGYLIYSISRAGFIHIVDLEASADSEKIKSGLLRCVEYIAAKGNYRALIAMTIKGTPFYDFMKNKDYLRNPYSRGPLASSLDFDIYQYEKAVPANIDLSVWDFNALNYDDI